jgi:hypothetical protein
MEMKALLEEVIYNCLDADSYDVEAMSHWTRKTDNPPLFLQRVQNFRIALEHALTNPGMVTPSDFNRWTGMDLASQAEVQMRLMEIRTVCFDSPEPTRTPA